MLIGGSDSALGGPRGAAEEGEIRRARERAVGEGTGVLIEREQEGIKGQDFEGGRGGTE